MRRRLYFVWMIILWGCVPESTSGTDSENVSGQSSMGMPSSRRRRINWSADIRTGEETAGQAALVSGGRMMTDNHGGRATPSDDGDTLVEMPTGGMMAS